MLRLAHKYTVDTLDNKCDFTRFNPQPLGTLKRERNKILFEIQREVIATSLKKSYIELVISVPQTAAPNVDMQRVIFKNW